MEDQLDRRNGSRLDADLLTATEIELLMRQCSRRALTGVRNRALIAVLWRSGLRIGEAQALAVKDFDPDSGTLVVQPGKGGKRRVVGVDAGTVALVSRWLDVRREREHSIRGPLFCSLAGKPVDASYVRRLLPRLARKAGIQRRAHADGLRHAFAVDLVRSGAAVRSCGTRSATRACRRRRSASAASGPTRRSRRCETATGRPSSATPKIGQRVAFPRRRRAPPQYGRGSGQKRDSV
jgi:site-specific recombinase XerD